MRDSRKRADIRSLANLAHTFGDALVSSNPDECGELLSYGVTAASTGRTSPSRAAVDRVFVLFSANHVHICG
jgi:hypothetical protein